jgi:hypothetical protein
LWRQASVLLLADYIARHGYLARSRRRLEPLSIEVS